MAGELLRLARTATFRLTLIYAITFVVSTIALFSYLYWRISSHVYEHERAAIEGEVQLLRDVERRSGPDMLRQEISARLGAADATSTFYLLVAPTGEPVAGNVQSLERRVGFFEAGVRIVTRPGSRSGRDETALFLGSDLPTGYFLAVGRDVDDLSSVNNGILERFLGALLFAVLLAFVGGSLLSVGFLRKLESINQSAETIMQGKLSHRIPVSGTRDEIDQLTANLNRMLDRIESLMETTRQVSNDIAHDLRTPLSRLRQRLEEAREARGGATAEVLDLAVEEIDGILSTFSALLRIAQIEAGSRVSNFKLVDLSAVFQTIAEVYGPVAEDRDQKLTGDIEANVSVLGDRELLTQMLANLVENALRYSPHGSTVVLGLRSEDGLPVGTVADTGPGIPAAERDKVFGRFYRLERNRTTPGNGLGLSLVAAVAELHGARITLGDNEPGLKVVIVF